MVVGWWVGWIRVIIIPLRGPSDQMRSDPQLELRCQTGAECDGDNKNPADLKHIR